MSNEPRIKSQKKLSPTRRFIGARMTESLTTIPQCTAFFDLETDALLALKDEFKARDSSVTITSMFVRMVADILREYPIVNSAVIDGQLIQYESCNVAVGVGLETGIMTAVVKEAQDKDIFAISRELREMTELIKKGELPLDEMKGSTFTISSIGVQGIRASTVVINPPESAMLAIGITEKRYVIDKEDNTAIRNVTSFALTHNHAVLDGYHVGVFVDMLRTRLENPAAYMGL